MTISFADEAAFGELAERYRRSLHLYLYRLVGSMEEAEDLVQETFLKAWRARASFEGRARFRTWLYSIATNAALNLLRRQPRRVLPRDVAPAATGEPRPEPPWTPEIPWLRPYPDRLLEPKAPRDLEPEDEAVRRETLELAYLAAIQHLPPRQRAILVLDGLDWPAGEIATLLETSTASVNSALQRARATMRTRVPTGRSDWRPSQPNAEERRILERFIAAWEQPDSAALVALLRDDAQWAMPPAPLWLDGRDAIAAMFQHFPIGWQGDFRMLVTSANRQPAAAAYLRPHGESSFRFVSLLVLRIEAAQIAEVVVFQPELCSGFDLPTSL